MSPQLLQLFQVHHGCQQPQSGLNVLLPHEEDSTRVPVPLSVPACPVNG